MYFKGAAWIGSKSIRLVFQRLWIHLPPWTLAGVVHRVRTEPWILEKVWIIIIKFAQQFPRPGKSLENRDKVLKNGKKYWVFFKAQQVLCKLLFFQTYAIFRVRLRESWKTLCSYVFKFCIDRQSITVGLEKLNYCMKKSGKSLEFWFQNSVQTLCSQ